MLLLFFAITGLADVDKNKEEPPYSVHTEDNNSAVTENAESDYVEEAVT